MKRIQSFAYVMTPLLVIAVLFLAILLVWLPKAHGASFLVTTTSDSGVGSLRQAISDANSTPGTDTISFNIAGAGPHTIALSTTLPTISEPVTIDGLTQSGASAGDLWAGTPHTLMIEIDGTSIPANYTLFNIGSGAGGTVIRGLSIGNLAASNSTCFQVTNATNVTIETNYCGLDADGVTVRSITNTGVIVGVGSEGLMIGGTTGSKGNVIIAPAAAVAQSSYLTSAYYVQNNFIGTTADGLTNLANGYAYAATSLPSSPSSRTNVNLIHNLVGGNIFLDYSDGGGATIKGNYWNTNRLGNANFTETGQLDTIRTNANAVIGGTSHTADTCDGDCNLFMYGSGASVLLNGLNNSVQGNFFGITGANVWAPNTNGVTIESGGSTTIGGATSLAGNRFASSYGVGVGGAASTVTIRNNVMGMLPDGSNGASMDNGVIVNATASDVYITQNTIRYAQSRGVVVGGSANDVSIVNNAIYDNAGLGIDLGNDYAVTANDANDSDTGPNDLLNFPTLASVAVNAGNTDIQYSLDVPAGDYRVDFYSNTAADGTNYGEGQTWLGSQNITHTGSGSENFSTTISGTGYTFVTSTATQRDASTDGFGASSEFSEYFTARADLVVSITDGQTQMTTCVAGDRPYTLTVTNNGPSPVDTLIFGLEGLSINTVNSGARTGGNPTTGGSFNYGTLTWTGLLNSGQNLVFTFQVSPTCTAAGVVDGVSLAVTVPTISYLGNAVADTNLTTDSMTDETYLPNFDVALTMDLLAPDMTPNGTAAYQMSLTNVGAQPMAMGPGMNAAIYFVAPAELTFVSEDSAQYDCADAGLTSGAGPPFDSYSGNLIICMPNNAAGYIALNQGDAHTFTVNFTTGSSLPSDLTLRGMYIYLGQIEVDNATILTGIGNSTPLFDIPVNNIAIYTGLIAGQGSTQPGGTNTPGGGTVTDPGSGTIAGTLLPNTGVGWAIVATFAAAVTCFVTTVLFGRRRPKVSPPPSSGY